MGIIGQDPGGDWRENRDADSPRRTRAAVHTERIRIALK